MQQMPDLWAPNIMLHRQQPHLRHVCTTPPHQGSSMCDNELQSRALLQPPADPLCQLPTTTQSLRPKLLHLCQDHAGNAPRQRSNHGHDNGRLESAQKVRVLHYLLYRSFFPPQVCFITYPQKHFDFGPKGRTGCHESFCTVARCYDIFGALLLRFLWCVYFLLADGKDGSPTGVVRPGRAHKTCSVKAH